MLDKIIAKFLSARFLFVLSSAIVFVVIGLKTSSLITVENVKEVFAAIVQIVMVVVVFYFTRTDRDKSNGQQGNTQ